MEQLDNFYNDIEQIDECIEYLEEQKKQLEDEILRKRILIEELKAKQ